MTDDELYTKLKTFEGIEVGTPMRAPDPVNEPMILILLYQIRKKKEP